MAKLAFFLSMLLAISFCCLAIVDSQQSHTQFENSTNYRTSDITELDRSIEGECKQSWFAGRGNATEIIPRDVIFGNPEKISVLISRMENGQLFDGFEWSLQCPDRSCGQYIRRQTYNK